MEYPEIWMKEKGEAIISFLYKYGQAQVPVHGLTARLVR
jgi:hypothetical protein